MPSEGIKTEHWEVNGLTRSLQKKNGLAKSHKFSGMYDLLFPASLDQNKCTRKADACS